jgi:4-amino-4-deoxy-L-arabinose transferase-like glycosyltransferase
VFRQLSFARQLAPPRSPATLSRPALRRNTASGRLGGWVNPTSGYGKPDSCLVIRGIQGRFTRIRAIRRRGLWAVVAILVAALAVRAGYVLATPGYAPAHDDRAFDALAVGVSRSGAYPDVGGHATAFRPPGYTYVLAGVYAITGTGHDRLTVARLVQVLEGTAVVGLLGLLAFRLFGWRASVLALLLSAFYPPLIAVGATLVAELQVVFLELASIAAVLAWSRTRRWRWIWVCGVLGGALTLTRSNGFFVVIAVAAGAALAAGKVPPAAPTQGANLHGAKRLLPALATLAIALVVVAPWMVRNAVVMRSLIPVSDELGGALAGTYNPVSAADKTQPGYWHLLSQVPQYTQQTRDLAGGPEPPFQNRLLHLALDYAGQHPLYVAKVAFYNTLRLADLHGLANDRFTATLVGITSSWMADATIIGFWVVFPLAVAGALIGDVRRRVPGFVWLATALLFFSIVFVNSETPRLRLPLDPFLILLAAGAIASFVRAPEPSSI